MRIVHLSTNDIGGAPMAAYRLHSGLKKAGIDSAFLSLNRNNILSDVNYFTSRPLRFYHRWLRKYGLEKTQMQNYYSVLENIKPRKYDVFTFPFSDFLAENSELVKTADIIHLHWVAGFINYESFFNTIKQPVIWTLHDKGPAMGGFHLFTDYERNNGELLKVEEKFRQIKFNAMKGKKISIVAPSNELKVFSEKSSILGEFNHSSIYNGFDFNQYKPLDKNFSRKIYGLPDQDVIFLFSGTGFNSFHKGPDIFLETVEAFEENESVRFLVLTDETTRFLKYKNVICHAPVASPVEMNILYAACDATLITSREENLPNMMLESFAAGRPVIATPVGGLNEIMASEPTIGLLSAATGSKAIIDAINEFIKNRLKYKEGKIIDFAMERFSLDLVTKEYLKLYEQVMSWC